MKAASLSFEAVSWTPIRGAAPVLKPTSFQLAPGRVLGVVGANGAGKSTLLRMIYRFLRPSTGSVRLDGLDIWALPARDVACKVSAVLQEQPSDFGLNVQQMIELGRIPHAGRSFGPSMFDEGLIADIVSRLDLSAFVGRRFSTLSGGERQRVMVGRALAQEPALLVLDEPTNHLDIRHQLEILRMIEGLEITVVTSLHDLNLAGCVCDDILLLDQGRMVGFGSPERVLHDAAVSSVFRVDARRERLSPSNLQHLTYRLETKERHPCA